MNALVQSLNIALREKVREEESGTYGIYVSPTIRKYPKEKYTLMIGFGCSPKNVGKLVKSVFGVIKKMQAEGPNEMTLKKVKETFIRSRQTSERENRFWINQLENSSFYGTKILSSEEYDAAVANITTEKIRKAAKKYLTTRHYVLGVLKPEK